MTHSASASRGGHPMTIFFLAIVFMVLLLWMGSSVAPGGATHTHLTGCGGAALPCGSGNATAGEVPPGQSALNFYDIPGGATDNFQSVYNAFILLFSGILVVIALMAGLVVWMARSKRDV